MLGGAKTQEPTRLNKIPINQSVLGFPLPVLMGAGKIQQSLLDVDGFKAAKVNNSGGKGMGGGKSGGYSYTYSANVIAALVAGPVTGVRSVIANGAETGAASVKYTLINGADNQAPWSLFLSKYSWKALAYNKIAYAAYGPMDLGSSAQIQQNIFELTTADNFSPGILDCDPVHCILRTLTDKTWGLGDTFPASVIDNGPTGTWGYEGGPSSGPTARNWFAAHSFFISPVIDRQESAASVIGKWLEAGACTGFMSEGLLKLVPYGDEDAAGNGLTFTAPVSFVVALDDTCFIGKDGEDPVDISSAPWQDANNKVQIQWNNRVNQYAPEVTPDWDQAAIDRYGLRLEDPQTYDFITTLPAAKFAASMRVRRNVYTRNTFTFSLPFRYSYLEPMDVVTISTTSVWAAGGNNENLGIVNRPVRIKRIVDNPDGTLEITAEDYLGSNHPTLYNKDISDGNARPDEFTDPGDTSAIIFEAPNRLTGFKGNELVIGAVGSNEFWGGCNVLVSQDGDTYRELAKIETPARIGILATAIGAGSDPDTGDIVIDAAEFSPALEGGTSLDADMDTTLCYLDGELISYSSCAVTSPGEFTLSGYTRRGRMGTTQAAHAGDTLFMRLDESVIRYEYDPAWAGKTVYFKFQSKNVYGKAEQDPATITPVAFTIPGENPGTVDASTGLINPCSLSGAPGADSLVHQGTCSGGGGNCYDYRIFSSMSYAVQPGDVLEYDIFLDPNSPVFASGIDFHYGSSDFRYSAVTDQNGIYANPTTDLSRFAKGSWYHRKIPIEVAAGQTITSWRIAFEGDIAGSYLTRYANIKITNAGTIQKVVWSSTAINGSKYSLPYYDTVGYSNVKSFTSDNPNLNSSSGLNGQGSIIPVQPLPKPNFNSTGTSITFGSSSQSMMLADGSTVTVNGVAKTYSGLNPGTAYYFYPYVRVSDYTIQFANPDPPPTGPNAVYATQAALDGRFSMPMFTVTTPASGGTGGGGGEFSCPEAGELVEVQGRGVIPVSDVEIGDYLKGENLRDGVAVYRKVINKRTTANSAWQILSGHKVSPCEPVWDGTGWTPAFKIPGAIFDASIGLKVEIHVDSDEYEECNYWLCGETPLLTHNMRIDPS